jgi:hypothetical protein
MADEEKVTRSITGPGGAGTNPSPGEKIAKAQAADPNESPPPGAVSRAMPQDKVEKTLDQADSGESPPPGAVRKPLKQDKVERTLDQADSGEAPPDESNSPAEETAAAAPAEEEELDPAVEEEIRNAVGPEVISSAAVMGASLAASAVVALIAINYERGTMGGKDEIHPTKSETDVNSVETKAKDTDAAVSDDSLAGTAGEVDANQTQGKLATTEATGADGGATAAATKAGALDQKAKAMNMT